jgi:hypothetical protein
MALKDILSLPLLLAAAGGFAAYRFLGKTGKERYYWTAGGVAAGYGAGKLLQGLMAKKEIGPVTAPPLQDYVAQPSVEPGHQLSEYAPVRDQGRAVEGGVPVDVDTMGSYDGTGESGLGSYAPGLDGDVDIDEVFRDKGLKI